MPLLTTSYFNSPNINLQHTYVNESFGFIWTSEINFFFLLIEEIEYILGCKKRKVEEDLLFFSSPNKVHWQVKWTKDEKTKQGHGLSVRIGRSSPLTATEVLKMHFRNKLTIIYLLLIGSCIGY